MNRADRKSAQADRCVTCGGAYAFSPVHERLVCSSCGSEAEVADIDLGFRGSLGCDGCGARVEGPVRGSSHACPFCDRALAAWTPSTQTELVPSAIKPFAMTERDARGVLCDWFEDMRLPPRDLTRLAEATRPWHSIYLPVCRTKILGFPNEFALPACTTLTELIGGGDALIPVWADAPVEPFRPGYLAGFRSVLPETTPGALALDILNQHVAATTRMERRLRRDFKTQARAAELRAELGELRALLNSGAPLAVDPRLILVPVWLSSYRWRGERHVVAIDGYSGRVAGNRPVAGLMALGGRNWAGLSPGLVGLLIFTLVLIWAYSTGSQDVAR